MSNGGLPIWTSKDEQLFYGLFLYGAIESSKTNRSGIETRDRPVPISQYIGHETTDHYQLKIFFKKVEYEHELCSSSSSISSLKTIRNELGSPSNGFALHSPKEG